MENPVTVNEKGKRRILQGHPWVFRSDVTQPDPLPSGAVAVVDSKNKFLGRALSSPHSQITLRMITREDEKIDRAFFKIRIEAAARYRASLAIHSNAYRVIFGESDGIPSFILDRYGDSFSFQILSAGLECFRKELLESVDEIFSPALLVERNDVSVRNLEKLPQAAQVLSGDGPTRKVIQEGELKFEVDLLEGQKTGAFLDQRDNRLKAGQWARNRKKALDAFSYQGWFSCHLAREAGFVIAVDQSAPACRMIEINADRNQLKNISVVESNVFDFLKEADQKRERFDLINLDPPAFVKSRSQLSQALKGYKEINLRAMKLLEPGGLLITSSCSHHLSEEEFLKLLQESARDAKRTAQIVDIGHQAADHPIGLQFPESKYLKCFFIRIL
jgi:23S rRNA (cytosine1962-C5)-methyltransferase